MSTQRKRTFRKFRDQLNFIKALAKNPKTIGAILPSSKHLAEKMVSYLPDPQQGVIVELGPGTGVFTQAMLNKGIPANQIIVVEYLSHFVELLRERFPGVTVIHGNAADLSHLLKAETRPVQAILSGLPLRSLPEDIKQGILKEIPKVLKQNGPYIQFTYDIRPTKQFYPNHYKPTHQKIVWRNTPPAKVEVFEFEPVHADL